MSDMIDDEEVFDESVEDSGDDEYVFVDEEFDQQLEEESLKKEVQEIKEKFTQSSTQGTIVEEMSKGFQQLGETLKSGMQPSQAKPEETDPDIIWFNSLKNEDYTNGYLTDGAAFSKRVMAAQEKIAERKNSQYVHGTSLAMGHMFLEIKKNDSEIGEYVKEYEQEIKGVLASMRPDDRVKPEGIDFAIQMVLGKHTKDLIGRAKTKSETKVSSPSLAKGMGKASATSVQKTQINLNKVLTREEIEDFRSRGMSERDIRQVAVIRKEKSRRR